MCVWFYSLDMAHFSLECDGLFIPDEQKSISEDPFDVLDQELPQKSNVILDPHYSDISDDDFEIPCSQKDCHLGMYNFMYGLLLLVLISFGFTFLDHYG